LNRRAAIKMTSLKIRLMEDRSPWITSTSDVIDMNEKFEQELIAMD